MIAKIIKKNCRSLNSLINLFHFKTFVGANNHCVCVCMEVTNNYVCSTGEVFVYDKCVMYMFHTF